jgi:BioD-like phosphotransacetylase family protein
MPTLLVSSLQPLAGKTAVSVGIARRLGEDGYRVAVARVATAEPDEAALADARCFSSLSLSAEKRDAPLSLDEASELAKGISSRDKVFIVELPAGLSPAEAIQSLGRAAVLVERGADVTVDRTAALQKELGEAFAGLMVTGVPRARTVATGEALAQKEIRCLALLPEDRLLSSPSIGETAQALQAETLFGDGRAEEVLERLTIAPIGADPGQEYFARFGRQAVVVRCDKPDLQLAALNAGSRCLILSGGRKPLAYVSDRAEAEGVPLLITDKGTVAALEVLEGLYFESRFGRGKAERIAQLLAEHLDYAKLVQVLGLRQKGSAGS